MCRRLGWLLWLALAGPGAAQAANTFGMVELVEGRVSVIDASQKITTPRAGDRIVEGCTLITGPDGELHIETMDHGLVTLRPNTRLRVDEYRAEGDAGDRQILSLVKGTFRSITGWIGRDNSENYEIRTPTATMGVRGTDHEPAYWPEAVAGEITADEVGTYDRVNEGRTFIKNDQGTLELGPQESGFVSKRRTMPRRLSARPKFYRGGRHESRISNRRQQLREKLQLRKQRQRTQGRDHGKPEHPSGREAHGNKAARDGQHGQGNQGGKNGKGRKK